MGEATDLIDSLIAEGARLTSELSGHIKEIDGLLKWRRAVRVFGRLTKAQGVLDKDIDAVVKFELYATEVLKHLISTSGGISSRASRKHFAESAERVLNAERDTLRMLLTTQADVVADGKERRIRWLTAVSLATALIALAVGVVTYCDAVQSGKKQEAAMGTELDALTSQVGVLKAMEYEAIAQQETLREISASTGTQVKDLETEELDARKLHELQARQEFARQFQQAAVRLAEFYRDGYRDIQREGELSDLARTLKIQIPRVGVPIADLGAAREIDFRLELAKALAAYSNLLWQSARSEKAPSLIDLIDSDFPVLLNRPRTGHMPIRLSPYHRDLDALMVSIREASKPELSRRDSLRLTVRAIYRFIDTDNLIYAVNADYFNAAEAIAMYSADHDLIDKDAILSLALSEFGASARVPPGDAAGNSLVLAFRANMLQAGTDQLGAHRREIESISNSWKSLEPSVATQLY